MRFAVPPTFKNSLRANSVHSARRRRVMPALLTTACLFVLAGCASYHDEPIAAETNAAKLEARGLADPALHDFLVRNHADPARAWTIQSLQMAAVYFSPTLAAARAQLSMAQAARITAAEMPNPTVSLSPTYDVSTPPPWILGISFDIPIETAGKRGIREDQAGHLSDAAIANLSASTWGVRSAVRTAFLAVYLAEQRHPLLVALVNAQEESARIFSEELKLGEVSPFEATQSEIALNQARFLLRDNQAELVNSRARLATAIGIAPEALNGIALDFTEFEHFPRSIDERALRRFTLVERADIRAGLANYDASQSALQLEIAKQYPDIHLGPGYTRDQGPGNINGQYDDKWTLGLTIPLPLFNQNQGAIAEAEARRKQAAANFDALQNKVLGDVTTALASYRSSLGKVEDGTAFRTRLVQQVDVAEQMLKLGELSKIEAAQRRLELTSGTLTELDAIAAAQAALGTLQDTLQSPDAVADLIKDDPASRGPALSKIASVPLPAVKGGFDLMTVTSDGRLLLDAEDNNTTEVIDLSNMTLRSEIGGMHQPKWVVELPAQNKLYVANGDGSVRVLNSHTYQLDHVISFREKANNMHFDPGTLELFVGVGDTFGALGVIDTKTDKIAGEIPLPGSPNQFVLDGKQIYINIPSKNAVVVVDRETKSVVSTWPVSGGKGNYPLALDSSHHRLFVGLRDGYLAVLDTRTGQQLGGIPIAADVDGVHYDAAAQMIYVSCASGFLNVIRQIDSDHYAAVATIPTSPGAGTSLLSPELHRLFLPIPQHDQEPARLDIYSVAAP